MSKRVPDRMQRLVVRLGFQRDWYLIALGAGIGTLTALGAIGFMWLLEHALERATGTLAAWPWWTLPLIPMAGALATGVLVHRFAREAKGHGVPEVMDAVYRNGGRIRKRVAFVKAIASALTIGSGGSAGAEGPIIQIGSAIGSSVAGILRIGKEHTSTLLGCGAAAGIASVFNAPIAGVFFVLEIILRDFSLRTFTPVVIASVFSAAVTHAVHGGDSAIFGLMFADYTFSLMELPSYIILGFVCAMVAVAFIKMLYASEDLADRVRVHPVVKPVIGALLLGLMGMGFLLISPGEEGTTSLPPFFGNGYPVLLDLLNPAAFGDVHSALEANVAQEIHVEAPGHMPAGGISTVWWMLALLVVTKAVATCMTLGSGGSGGVFAPSLFLGAAAGALFGVALDAVGLLPESSSPAAYALVGMAAVVAGTTHAPLTAILIVFEITRNVYVLLPIMLAAVVATVLAQIIMPDSVYTLKLRRRGVLLGSSADLTILRKISARQVPIMPHVAVQAEDPLSRLLDLNRQYQVTDFVVTDNDGRYRGMVTAQDLRTALIEREAMPLLAVDDLMRTDLPPILQDETLDRVLDKFSRHDIASLPLISGDGPDGRVLGLITRGRLMQKYHQALHET